MWKVLRTKQTELNTDTIESQAHYLRHIKYHESICVCRGRLQQREMGRFTPQSWRVGFKCHWPCVLIDPLRPSRQVCTHWQQQTLELDINEVSSEVQQCSQREWISWWPVKHCESLWWWSQHHGGKGQLILLPSYALHSSRSQGRSDTRHSPLSLDFKPWPS